MENILFKTLCSIFLGAILLGGLQSTADHLETQVNHVSHCIDQANSQYSTC